MKEKVLISACLIGENCRYDGTNKLQKELLKLAKYYDLIPICPEVSGGLKTPRHPSEIKDGKVFNQKGRDVTDQYHDGAYWALSIIRLYHIRLAIMKEDSPSCGVHHIYDGSFTGKKIDGQGITTRRLVENRVKVINETEALELLKSLEEKQNTSKN
jgi:uncharacterized protein YbbK (DUF523 family)